MTEPIDGGEAQDFTERQNLPFMVGVYLAVNALADAYLLVDGPDCAHMKTQYVQGNHDWLSTLTDISGFHRVANTALHPFHMARSREDEVVDLLSRIAAHPQAGVALITPMPMAAITGVDYDRLARLAADRAGGRPVVHVPGRSLSADWLGGYGLTLSSLASSPALDLSGPAPDPARVAIVGYLMDRNEGDHVANLRVLRDLLARLDLELCSTWLGGGTFEELREVKRAGLIVSLPYGRRAARVLGRRLGIEVLETALPFGLDGTARWLRQVAAATGRLDRVEAVIDDELTRVAPPLQWVVPAVLLHRTVAFIGDPHLLEGFLDFTAELGLRHGPMIVTARADHTPDLAQRLPSVAFEPTRARFMELLEPLRRDAVDLVVTNSTGCSLMAGSTPVMEFGFPSYFTHALYPRPFLGFEGALAFADSMANALRRVDLLRRRHGPEAPDHAPGR